MNARTRHVCVTQSIPVAARPFVVVIAGSRKREWSRYLTKEQADEQCKLLKAHGFNATVVVDTDVELPEHNNDRRRFLVWALMLGAIEPERVVERVLEEVEQEVAAP